MFWGTDFWAEGFWATDFWLEDNETGVPGDPAGSRASLSIALSL